MTVLDTEGDRSAGLIKLIPEIGRSSGIVGARYSSVSMTTQLLAKRFLVPQVSYASTNDDLSNKKEFPFFSRVVPTNKHEGAALASLISNFGWHTCALIYERDTFATLGVAFERAATRLGIRVLSQQSLFSGQQDIAALIAAVTAARTRVVVLAAALQDKLRVLAAAHRAGITGAGFTWVLNSVKESNVAALVGSPRLRAATQGCLGLIWRGGTGARYHAFLRRWAAANASRYYGAGRPISEQGVFAVDALYALAHGLHAVRQRQRQRQRQAGSSGNGVGVGVHNGSAVLAAIRNSSFQGLTGGVRFDAVGDRVGAAYTVLNLFDGKLSPVGSWAGGKLQLSPSAEHPLRWADGSATVPSDNPCTYVPEACAADDDLPPPLPVAIAAAVAATVVLCAAAYIVRLRGTRIIRAAQPPFCLLMLAGALLLALWPLLLLWRGQCMLRMWALNLSFTVTVGSLLVKAQRVWTLLSNPRLHRTLAGLRTSALLAKVAVLLLLDVALMTLWQLVAPSTLTPYTRTLADGRLTVTRYRCAPPPRTSLLSATPLFLAAAFKAAQLLAACYLSFAVRSLQPLTGDSLHLVLAVYNIAFVACLALAVALLPDLPNGSKQLVLSIALAWAVVCTVLALFLPKFLAVNQMLRSRAKASQTPRLPTNPQRRPTAPAAATAAAVHASG